MTTKSLSKRSASKKDLVPAKQAKTDVKKSDKKSGKKSSKKVVEESESEASMDEDEELEELEEQEDDSTENHKAVDGEEEEGNPKHDWMTPEQKEEKKRVQKEEQKKLRLERKMSRPGYDLIQSVRPEWDIARRMDTPKEKRLEAVGRLFAALSGKFRDVILKHEGSRVVQTCVKHGSAEQRKQVARELSGSFLDVAKNKYGKHIVNKLMLYCPDQREVIMNEFSGHILKAMRHKEASVVVEAIFATYANAQRKQRIVQEFYGAEFALFKKDQPQTLAQVLAETPDKRSSIVKSLEEALGILLIKGNLGMTLVHRLILEFLDAADQAKAQEWIGGVADFLPEILHTSDGARAVARCIAMASSKDRKAIVKSFKPFVEKICKDDRGFQTLLAIFSLVDDTVLVGKVLLSEVKPLLASGLLKDTFGRKIVGYLVCGPNRRLLPHQTVQLLEEVRAVAVAFGTSKKDPEIRLNELRAQILDDIVTALTAQLPNLVKDMETAVFLAEIIGHLPSQQEMVSQVLTAFGEASFQPGPKCECLKKIIKASSPEASQPIFDAIVANLSELAAGEAAYMLMHMLRFQDHPISGQVRKLQSKLKKIKDSAACQTLLAKIAAE